MLTKQAVKDMCVLVAESKPNGSSDSAAGFPSLPASATVKTECTAEPHMETTDTFDGPQSKKIKMESEDYDDWLDDVMYIKTEEKEQSTTSALEIINKEMDRYDAEVQIKGDPLEW